MADLYLRFKLRAEVGDNEMQTCIYAHGRRKFFSRKGPIVDFPGVENLFHKNCYENVKFQNAPLLTPMYMPTRE